MMKSKAEREADEVREALELLHRQGAFPQRPVIRRFDVQADNDYAGDPAYHITVLLDDATPEDELTWEAFKPIHRLVFDETFRGPDERWPYVRIVRESDQYLTVEE